MKMYVVQLPQRGMATLSKIQVRKVTEHTVVDDRGVRYKKRCNSYELFDSFNIAKICAVAHTERYHRWLTDRAELTHEHLTNLRELEL